MTIIYSIETVPKGKSGLPKAPGDDPGVVRQIQVPKVRGPKYINGGEEKIRECQKSE